MTQTQIYYVNNFLNIRDRGKNSQKVLGKKTMEPGVVGYIAHGSHGSPSAKLIKQKLTPRIKLS